MKHAIIIGNGITGVSAARELRRLKPDWRITMISGESTYHYSRPALMYIFMGHMTYHDTKPYPDSLWQRERIELLRDWVVGIDAEHKTLALHQHGTLAFDTLLIATGSKSNRFDWPGQDLPGVQGLYDLMDLKQLYENIEHGRNAVIVGGGLIGIELGEMLHSRGIRVTFLVREKSYWNNILPAEESAMVNRIIRQEGFDLRLESEMAQINAGSNGRAESVTTRSGETIPADIVGLTAGVSPNIDLVRETDIQHGRGVIVNATLQTSHPEIFAAGDCAEIEMPGSERNLLQQVWYTGKMQGVVAARNMAGENVNYDPGIWYNSAKFLDLEYQTYGSVPANDAVTDHLYWEHDDGLRSLRLVHDNGIVAGVNVMGMRVRHRVCDRWIAKNRTVEYALDHLEDAMFDAEFSASFEDEIRQTLSRSVPA
ncbi:MAG: NAD(P)/FAD-dependent oxidoreductase [Phycisphaerales bacterium]